MGSWAAIVRAFCVMMGGVLSYFLSCYLKEKKYGNKVKILLTIAEFTSIAIMIGISYFSLENILWIDGLSIINIAIMFSCQSYTVKIPETKILFYFGKLSMIMYIWHWVIATFINCFFSAYRLFDKILLLYIITFIVSNIHLMINKVLMINVENKRLLKVKRQC